jgi:hypothetical protein
MSNECSTCNTAPRIERKCLIKPLCDVVTVMDEDLDVGANRCRRRFEERRGEERRGEERRGEERIDLMTFTEKRKEWRRTRGGREGVED